jgi:hypothetical protein
MDTIGLDLHKRESRLCILQEVCGRYPSHADAWASSRA